MLENISLSSSDSLDHQHHFYNFSLPFGLDCLMSRPTSSILIGFYITRICLLLPLCVFILHHGLQQWRQKNSTSSAATMSHSDCFTYHLVTMELFGVFGCALNCCGIYMEDLILIIVGSITFSLTWYGQMFFEVVTCVERYLAVIHPITYRSLRNERGVRIRNISISCIWLLSLVGMILGMLNTTIAVEFSLLMISLVAISFCSLAVLHVLLRPGPGEQVGGRGRVDQSKQKAFYTILAILGVLTFKVAWGLVDNLVYTLDLSYICVMTVAEVWWNMPSSLLLPLLFLHRTGKLGCCKKTIQLGQG